MPLFKIYDGRPVFWQWDVDRKLIIDDAVCEEVHFSNGTADRSLVCAVYELDGLRVANVPNILMQTARPISVYAYLKGEEGGYTKRAELFEVRRRPKPDDYVYTETEVKNWDALDERIKALEGEGIANAVAAYLEENPIEAGATAEEAAQIQQNTESIEALTTEKLDASALPEAVNEALAQAKASGELKGEKGDPGDPGLPGADYVLTEADKTEIAEQAAQLVPAPDVQIPSALPNPNALTFTGAVSATYDGSQAVQVEIPQGGGGGSAEWITLVSEIITEPVKQYRRTLTADEREKLINAKKVKLCMKTPQPTSYSLTGTSVFVWSNYTRYFVACNNVALSSGSGYQFAISITDLNIAGWEQRAAATGCSGVAGNSTYALVQSDIASIRNYDIQIRGDTTAEDGFPAGTTFSLEVLL